MHEDGLYRIGGNRKEHVFLGPCIRSPDHAQVGIIRLAAFKNEAGPYGRCHIGLVVIAEDVRRSRRYGNRGGHPLAVARETSFHVNAQSALAAASRKIGECDDIQTGAASPPIER